MKQLGLNGKRPVRPLWRLSVTSLRAFTRKFDDNSTEEGFQFTFYCDISGDKDSYKTKFIASRGGKKAGGARLIGKGISFGGSILGKLSLGTEGENTEKVAEKGAALTDEISKRFGQMSPAWHEEHGLAFEGAQKEAMENFDQCPVCKRWVCEYCWNGEKGMCIEDGKQLARCPSCGEPTGAGRFCTNCGAALSIKCPSCGMESPAPTRFCSNCGTKLGEGPKAQ